MQAKIYKVKQGYNIVTSDNRLYSYTTRVKYIGKVGDNWQPSGKLIKDIPDNLKTIFFQLQKQSND
jgi:hypothetical protein